MLLIKRQERKRIIMKPNAQPSPYGLKIRTLDGRWQATTWYESARSRQQALVEYQNAGNIVDYKLEKEK